MRLPIELRPAVRSLLRAPGFTLLATAMLATGIGLALYMFGAINGFVLRPLPYADSERLIHFELTDPNGDPRSALEVAFPDLLEIQRSVPATADFVGFYEGTLNLSDRGEPERLEGVFATGNLFSTLGVRPLHGRTLRAEDSAPGAAGAVVLSEVVWKRRFDADPEVVGRAVRVNGKPATIVGVAPASFRFPIRTEAWAAIPEDAARLPRGETPRLEVIGHLAPGATATSLAAEIDSVLARLGGDGAGGPRVEGVEPRIKPFAEEWVGTETRSELGVMFAAVILVLLIACANVANLLYGRGLARRRDLAIRTALGAGRSQLVVYGLVEALVVAILAALIGLPLAQWGGRWTMEWLRANPDMDIPTWVNFETDGRTIVFMLLIAFVAAVAAGIGPALAGSKTDPQKELRATTRGGGGGHRRRASRILVVTQIALSFALVAAAGLAARSLVRLAAVDPGVDGSKILGGRIALLSNAYPDAAARLSFWARAEEAARAIPGVTEASVTTSLPASFSSGDRIEIEGEEPVKGGRFVRAVRNSPSYFATLDTPLTGGRNFTASDDATAAPVAIVDGRFARAHFAGKDPLGRRFRSVARNADDKPGPWMTIVGLAPDLLQQDIDDLPTPAYYQPLLQTAPTFAFVAVRSAGDATALAEPLRRAITAIDPDQPVYFLRTVDEWSAIIQSSNRFLASLFGVFAFAGLALAAVGVYGVTAYAVTQRTGEIGLRRALGAFDGAVVRLIARRSLRDLAWGLGIGAVLAAGAGPQVAGMFYGVRAFDPWIFTLVPLVLALAVVLATLAPVRQALRIEPAVALRNE